MHTGYVNCWHDNGIFTKEGRYFDVPYFVGFGGTSNLKLRGACGRLKSEWIGAGEESKSNLYIDF
jgi:hypothetical protein